MKYNKDTVRKNVTITKSLSENLEQASFSTGASQSAIIEAAFKQPAMKRLFAFCSCDFDDDHEGDCVLNLLDCEAALLDSRVDGYMTGRTIIGVLRDIYLPAVVMKSVQDTLHIRRFHEYCLGHMPVRFASESSVMSGILEDFRNGTFYSSDFAAFIKKINLFMTDMMEHREFLGDSSLYKILGYIFGAFTRVPELIADDIMKEVFRGLCEDRRVFGIMPEWA